MSSAIIRRIQGSYRKNHLKPDYPPCFVPAVLAGLSWFVERCKIASKNRDVFWSVRKPQYQEANNIFPNAPTTRRNGLDQSISYLYLIRSDFLFWIPQPPGRITKAGSGEDSSSLNEIRSGNRLEKQLTELRGGGN